MNYDNQSFRDESVELTGNRFHGCTFERCKLIYRGDVSPTFHDNHFIDSPTRQCGPSTSCPTFITQVLGATRSWKIPFSVFVSARSMDWRPAPSRRTRQVTAWSRNRVDHAAAVSSTSGEPDS